MPNHYTASISIDADGLQCLSAERAFMPRAMLAALVEQRDVSNAFRLRGLLCLAKGALDREPVEISLQCLSAERAFMPWQDALTLPHDAERLQCLSAERAFMP